MTEVTDEMLETGLRIWAVGRGPDLKADMAAAYRAMRALEPKPVEPTAPRDQRMPINRVGLDGQMGTKPGAVHLQRMCDVDVNAGPDAQAAFGGYGSGIGQSVNPAQQAEIRRRALNGHMEPESVEGHRLDALQALVLVLAARSPGYPPGDATLTRLIAELENAK